MAEVIHNIQEVANEFQDLVKFLNQWGNRVPGLGWCLKCGRKRIPPVYELTRQTGTHEQSGKLCESFTVTPFSRPVNHQVLILPDSQADVQSFVHLLNKWPQYVPTLGWCPVCQTGKACPWFKLEWGTGLGQDSFRIIAYPRVSTKNELLLPWGRSTPERKGIKL